jgi:RNA polymerase sigma-70 factor (ECF subfamily)
VRARRKITEAAIPYKFPDDESLAERLGEVLAVLYLMFNEGYLTTGGPSHRRDLSDDAVWLTGLVCSLLPKEPEPLGLLALMKIHLARVDARFGSGGEIVLLQHQDRTLWNRAWIDDAVRWIERAAAIRRLGPYQIEAAIAAVHAEAPTFASTDWAQILALYDLLLTLAPSPVVRLNRAIAVRHLYGAEAALVEVDGLAEQLDGYHLFHATRGELLMDLGRREQARAAQLRARDLTHNPAEQALLGRRID